MEKILSVSIVSNALIFPVNIEHIDDAVIFDDKNTVIGNSVTRPWLFKEDVFNLECDCSQFDYIDEDVIFGGYFFCQYGHFLFDFTTRLWYWLSIKENKKIVFVCKDKVANFVWEFFNLLDIKKGDIIIVKKPTKFKKITIPDIAHNDIYFNKQEFLEPFNYISQKVESKNISHLYLVYRHFNNNVYGEDLIEKNFAANGYLVLSPEKMSLREQISYYKGCSHFAGLDGSLLFNSLWSQSDSIECLCLQRADLKVVRHEKFFKLKGIEYKHINVYLNPVPTYQALGPFWVGVTTDLKEAFKDYKYNLVDCNNKNYFMDFISDWLVIYSQKGQFDTLCSVFPFYNKNSFDSIKNYFTSISSKRKIFINYFIMRILNIITFKSNKKIVLKYKYIRNLYKLFK